VLEKGSYFGDISFIFRTINKYNLIPTQGQTNKLFSLQEDYIYKIFDRFPEFRDVLTVRALRRHHYFRKLKNQQL
jgi:hypothetical protein